MNFTEENDKMLIDKYVKLMWGEFSEISQKYHLAPLILAFSVIEANAKLCAPDSMEGSRNRFIWWVENFFQTNRAYTALDLYGARCGLFHEYGSGSKLSRDGKCKEIVWSEGNPVLHGKGKDNILILSKEKFFNDLYQAGLKVLEKLKQDHVFQDEFVVRLRQIFGVKNVENLSDK